MSTRDHVIKFFSLVITFHLPLVIINTNEADDSYKNRSDKNGKFSFLISLFFIFSKNELAQITFEPKSAEFP